MSCFGGVGKKEAKRLSLRSGMGSMTTLTDQAVSISISRRMLEDPAWFLRSVLGADPYPKQIEIAKALLRYPQVAVCGPNASGKDFLTARLVLLWLQLWPQAKVVIYGPTYRQVSDIIWNEVRSAFNGALIPLAGKMHDEPNSGYFISPDRFAIGFSTDRPITITGFHSPHLLVILTEAHAIEQPHIDMLKMLQYESLLMTGNALSDVGEFYDAFERPESPYHTLRISPEDIPNIAQGKVVIPGLLTLEDIRRRKADWGEDSPLYRASILALFTRGTLGGLRNIEGCIHGELMAPQPGHRYIASWDHARLMDYNWLLIGDAQTRRVVYSDRWNLDDWDVSKARVRDACVKYYDAELIIDGTGEAGDMLHQDLVKMGMVVERFEFTQDSKRALIAGLQMAMEREQVRYPNIPELLRELRVFRQERTGAGNIVWGAPSGYHDDGVISLAMLVKGLGQYNTSSRKPVAIRNW